MVALLKKQGGEQAHTLLDAVLGALADVDWSHKDNLIAAIYSVAKQFNVKPGPAFGTVRIATTGRTQAPDQADLMLVLGPGRVDQRIRAAIDALKAAGEG